MEQAQALNVAIVGGGPGCKAIMDMMVAEKLSQLRMRLIGVACTNPEAVGYRYAQERGIYTTTDYVDLYRLEDLGLIIELTGRDEIAKEISRSKPEHVRLIDHVAARLFWDVFRIEEERLEERKRSEEALARAEREKETILDSLVEHVVHDNKEMSILWANRAACESAGMTRKELTGRRCYEVWPKRSTPCPDCSVVEAMKTGQPREVEKTTPDGRVWRVRGYPERDTKGDIVGGIEVTLDITERKRAEEALRLTQFAIDRSADAAFWMGPDARFLYVNEAACRSLGYSREELLSMSVHDIDPGFPAEVWPDHWREMRERGSFTVQSYHSTKNGQVFPVEVSVNFVDFEGEEYNCAFVRNIADRKRAEEALVRAKEDWENTFDATTDMVMVLDHAHRIVRVNKAVAEALKATKESLVGKKCYEIFHRRSHPINRCPLVETMKTLSPHTVELKDPDMGGTFICSTSPMLDGEGRLAGYTHVLKDITESKRLEAQFQQAQRLEAVGTLAGGIAHDFNNLLMGIQGRVSLMLMDMDSDHPHFMHVSGIEGAVKRGADLTKQLLGFARGGKYEVRPTDLNDLLEKSSEMLGRAKKEIRLHRKHEKQIWTVEVDRGQIEQVLVNLYVNAWQAMPEGGDLYLATKNVELPTNVARAFDVKPGKYVKISATDTGVGMDEATRQRVFEPFFTTKELGVGTGLGLASAYGIVKNHGGIIEVSSAPDQGATFHIYLPASGKEIGKDNLLPEDILEGTETVLLVDDEDMIMDVGRDMLTALGYKVMEASNGRQALKLYEEKQGHIDMVVLDLIMPDMGGGEVYDRMKEMNPKVKVLLSSGYSIDDRTNDILKRGCDGFIQKPFSVKELSGKLREILEKE